MAFSLPSTLKLTQLKQLAFKCGISSSGTKPILSRRLLDEISLVQSAPAQDAKDLNQKSKGTRILSIDMGIRNLAYCILDAPAKRIVLPGTRTSKANPKDLPSIHAWHRLAVSTAPTTSDTTIAPAREAFDPSTLSRAAYTLLRHRLLPSQPTHILIERQRFRSMGSKHILEWTIRVNMFESILYGALCALKEEGVWAGEVRAVAPGKVGPFWIEEEDSSPCEAGQGKKKVRKSQSAKIRNKGLKIDLVRGWLESGDVMRLGNDGVEEIARAYREKWDRLPGGRKGPRRVEEEGEKMGKLDDLADCLLQGMAWVQWEENKRVVLKYGVEALLDP
ncbi:hypothetical protein PZA11_007800 [Diplocarpon coronariae]|uniref:SAP domain-containing protein n=1 Tax=Diplocarpon coronariae TaxID=2795749 RepID=A0A218ZEI0_9HELO|nr:hypothetical protein JHW43_003170 [Diplocarpon mali]OWP06000.1 hypothetical protein B2J93_6324 [Marssonina coronariae]